MDQETILVLADPAESRLAHLEQLPPETGIAVGLTPEAFERAAPEATVIFSWAMSRDLLRAVLAMAPRVRWVHTRSAGLDNLVFPELLRGPAILTNGRGVFSHSLGEWVMGAMLYFAKGFRRLVNSQMAGKWDPFDVVEISGQTVGIVGYGDIGRAVASRARALGMRVLGMTRRGPLNGSKPCQALGPLRNISSVPSSEGTSAATSLRSLAERKMRRRPRPASA
jgi:phosphoglycerate dehydrogenase-like enzyme